MKNSLSTLSGRYFLHPSTPVLLLVSLLLTLLVLTVYLSINHDSAWLMHQCLEFFRNRKSTSDLFGLSLPAGILLHFLPAYLTHAYGIGQIAAFKLYVFSVLLFYMVVFYWQLRIFRLNHLSIFYLLALMAPLLFLPHMEFGQRDHFVFCFLLTYIATVAIRVAGRKPPLLLAILSGTGAALALAIKPNYVVVLAFAEIYFLTIHRSLKGVFRPETLALALGAVAYFLVIVFCFPDVIERLLPLLLHLYWAYNLPLPDRILPAHVALLAFVLITCIVCRPPGVLRRIQLLMMVTICGSWLSYLSLGNVWIYRQYPFLGFTYIYILLFLAWYFRYRKDNPDPLPPVAAFDGNARPLLLLNMVLLVVFSWLLLCSSGFSSDFRKYVHGEKTSRFVTSPGAQREREVLESIPPFKSLYVMDANLGPHIQLMLEMDLDWASRFHTMWMFPAWARAHAHDPLAKGKSLEFIDAAVKDFYLDIEADILKNRPEVFIVDTSQEKHLFNGVSFDYIAEFSRNIPSFAEFWKNYQLYKTFYLDNEQQRQMSVFIRRDKLLPEALLP